MMKGSVLVVVADGGAARFFERERADAKLRERHDLAMKAEPLELPRERLGRVHDRIGPARHSMEPRQYPRAALQRRFLKAVADAVNAAADAGSFKALVLCAPPRPLGLLREHLSDSARQRLSQEFAKDYVRTPVDELDERLRAG